MLNTVSDPSWSGNYFSFTVSSIVNIKRHKYLMVSLHGNSENLGSRRCNDVAINYYLRPKAT